MRVLLVTHRFLPRYLAGTEVYSGRLAQALAERGHAVQIFSGDPAAAAGYAYDWAGLPVRAVPWNSAGPASPLTTFLAGFANPPVERQFDQLCAEFKPDIVHIQHLMGLSPRLPGISRRQGARVIITLHDYWFQCSNTILFRYSHQLCPGPGLGYHCGGCAQQRLGRKPGPVSMALTAPVFMLRTALLGRVLAAADRVVAPSQTAARAFAGNRALAAKLRVIPHGLSAAPRAAAAAGPRDPARPLQFVYVGSLVRPKGIDVIVQAFAALPPSGASLHLYGDPAVDPAYVEELRRLAAGAGVILHGPAPRAEVGQILKEADVLLAPSLWRETFSVIVDEAFEAGTPVVVSAVSAAVERVTDGVNGLVAPAGDAQAWRQVLLRLSQEPGLIDRLRQGIVPPQTLARHTAEIERLYAEAMGLAPEAPGATR